MGERGRGHRVVPHTADIRVEAWAPTREECVTEAVLGTISTFVDTTTVTGSSKRTRVVEASSDEDLLVAVLDEVIYLLDVTGEVPVEVALEAREGGAEVRFGMVAASELPQVGAVPKAVSLHELRFVPAGEGWSCSVTLDV
jgi:SHS2 domain-containing protein